MLQCTTVSPTTPRRHAACMVSLVIAALQHRLAIAALQQSPPGAAAVQQTGQGQIRKLLARALMLFWLLAHWDCLIILYPI